MKNAPPDLNADEIELGNLLFSAYALVLKRLLALHASGGERAAEVGRAMAAGMTPTLTISIGADRNECRLALLNDLGDVVVDVFQAQGPSKSTLPRQPIA